MAVDWSKLPTELLGLIALRLISVVEVLRFRSICTSWRSSVTLADINNPLLHIRPNLEIQPSYTIQKRRTKKADPGFKRVVAARKHLVRGANHRVLGVCCDGRIRYWDGDTWTRIKDQTAHFHDIIIHQGLPYALDSRGVLWWVSSRRGIFRYGPPLDDDVAESCSWRYRSLVGGSCGKFYIVDRIVDDNRGRIKGGTVDPRYVNVLHDDVGNTEFKVSEGKHYHTTVGFKVYMMDDDLWQWVQVKSLGDDAFLMGDDTCLAVKADEFYGCLRDSIYYTDEDEDEIKVFKVDDGSMSGDSQSCFEMFVPSFD